jgi:outer membrane protein with beta-barrel domain
MKKTLLALTGVAAFALLASQAQAQVRTAPNIREPARFGFQVNYGNDSHFGVGVRVRHGLQSLFPAAPLSGIGSVDIYFPDHGVTWLDLNYNVVYNFRPASTPKLTPYAGGGLNFASVSGNGLSDSKLGINIMGGTEFRSSGRLTPFAELRLEISGGDQLVLTGGLKF